MHINSVASRYEAKYKLIGELRCRASRRAPADSCARSMDALDHAGLLSPRERNTDENTPLQLFDEMEIHPLVICVETDTCPNMFPTVYQCLEKLGKPRNYGKRYGSSYIVYTCIR
jgi:hypothetical protein